jgi:hypothetical protein
MNYLLLLLKNVALLSFPVWGTIATIGLASLLPKSMTSLASLLFVPWGVGMAFASKPIRSLPSPGAMQRAFSVVFFYCFAIVLVGFVAWASACFFFKACR